MDMKYKINGQGGAVMTATSLNEAKRCARTMCIRNVGASSNMMMSGTYLPAPRLYWTEWCDGTIIGDPTPNYDGDNPLVSIRRG
jgi:hypothetical protein